MIYITGDTHIPCDIKKLFNLGLTEDDFVIICGDFGLIWNYDETGLMIPSCPEDKCWTPEELMWIEYLASWKFTTLWVDGNHENYDRLSKYPISEWHGGKVQKISDKVIHLMRGQIFDLNGKAIFTMGGASSHDRGYATGTEKWDIHICWWPDEVPSNEDWDEAKRNLANHKIDYIITHEAPSSVRRKCNLEVNGTSEKLQEIYEDVEFSRWYCGHLHIDKSVDKVRVLFDDLCEMGKTERVDREKLRMKNNLSYKEVQYMHEQN